MTATFDDCDGVLWHIENKNGNIEIDSTIYKYENRKIKPDELGHMFHILTYKENDEDSVEVMSAYIGDVQHFVNNYSKAGYNGLMVKNKVVPKKSIKLMFKKILQNWQFSESKINAIMRQV